MTRTRLFGAVCVIGVLNALASRIITSYHNKGFWLSLSDTFGVSAIVWFALVIIVSLTLTAPVDEAIDSDDRVRVLDAVLAAVLVAFATLVPASALIGAALVPLALWGLFDAKRGAARRRISAILLSLTLTLFWGPLALRSMPELLQADAHFVAWIIGGEVQGNIYTSPNGLSRFMIAPGCSSLTNMTMATIFAVSLTQYFGMNIGRKLAIMIGAASILTVLVNIARLAVIAYHPADFVYWHDGPGAVMFRWAALAVIVSVVGMAIDRWAPDARR